MFDCSAAALLVKSDQFGFYLFPSGFFLISGLLLILVDFCQGRSPPVLLCQRFFPLQLGRPLLWVLVNGGAREVQMQDAGRPVINLSHLTAHHTELVSPDFNLDKLTEKVWPSDYVLIFLWVSRTERYNNVLILIVLNSSQLYLSCLPPDLIRSYLTLYSSLH